MDEGSSRFAGPCPERVVAQMIKKIIFIIKICIIIIIHLKSCKTRIITALKFTNAGSIQRQLHFSSYIFTYTDVFDSGIESFPKTLDQISWLKKQIR